MCYTSMVRTAGMTHEVLWTMGAAIFHAVASPSLPCLYAVRGASDVLLYRQRVDKEAAVGFAAAVGTTGWKGCRVLSLRHGPEAKDLALYRASPMPKGEVETLVNTRRLTKKLSDNNLPSEEEERASSSGAEATYGMMSMKNFSNEDNVKALMSMGEA